MNKKLTLGLGVAALGIAVMLLASCGGEAKKYKITFESNGGTAVSPVEVEWNQVPTMPENPTRSGYTFVNWFNDQGLTKVYEVGPVTNDFTLYAGWSINQYTVTFNSMGGSEVAPITGNYNATITPPTTQRDYYTFAGWYTDNDYTSKFDNKIPSTNITVFAKWKAFNATFEFNKNSDFATGNMDNFQVRENSPNKTLPLNQFELTGYDFKGWALTPDGEVIYHDGEELEHVEFDSEEENVVLYAIWDLKDVEVNFYASSTEPFYSEPLKYGDIVRKPGITPIKDGYTFKGWGTMAKTADTTFNPEKDYYQSLGASGKFVNISVTAGEPVEGVYYEVTLLDFEKQQIFASFSNDYYALFTKNQYKVSFVDLTNNEEIYFVQDYFGSVVTTRPNTDKEGYRFLGFFFDKDCKEPVGDSTIVIGSADRVIYANYSVNSYDLVISKGDGSAPISSKLEYGTKLSTVLPTVSKTGYEFKGWFTDEECTIPLGEDATMPVSTAEEPYAVFGKLEEATYSISFETNEPTITKDPINKKFGASVSQEELSINRTGYKVFWYMDEDLTQPLNFTLMPANNVKLWAKWEPITYSVFFRDVDDKIISDTQSVKFGSLVTKPSDPTKTGYTFDKWMNGDVEFDFAKTKMDAAHITLHASWTANDNDISVTAKSTKVGSTELMDIGSQTLKNVKTGTEAKVTSDNAVSIPGFTFVSSETTVVKGDGNDKLVTTYSRNKYNVNFIKHLPGGGTDIVTLEREFEAKIGSVTGLEINGYTFKYYIDSVEKPDISNITIGTSDIDIDVIYTEFTGVSFNANGGKIGDKDTYVFEGNVGADVIFPENPTRVGYTFAGWFTDPIEGEQITKEGYKVPSGGASLYAHWDPIAVSVVYIINGEAQAPVTEYYGVEANFPTGMSKAGHTFTGWTVIDADGNESSFTAKQTSFIPMSTSYTITPQFTANTLTIKFFDKAPGTVQGSMDDQNMSFTDSGDARKLNANNFAVAGYNFIGWALEENGEVVYLDGATIGDDLFVNSENTLNLYAKWSKKDITITFDTQGGSDVDSITNKFGEPVDSPEIPTKAGYTFTGWYTAADDSGERYYFSTMPAESITLYAHWSVNYYNILFDSNGGSDVYDSNTFKNGSSLDGYKMPENPDREGYDFVGWFTQDGTYDEEGNPNKDWGEQVTEDLLKTITINANDVTFYAQWKAHKHTIHYYAEKANMLSETSPIAEIEVMYGSQITGKEAPDKTGQAFLGWYDANGYYSFTVMPDHDLYLYPVYSSSKYHITYYGEDGKVIFEVDSDAFDPSFNGYIRTLLNKEAALDEIYKAIQDAITWGVLDVDEQEARKDLLINITAVGTYANVGGLDDNGLSYALLNAQKFSDEQIYPVLGTMAYLPYSSETKDYYGLVALTGDNLSKGSDISTYKELLKAAADLAGEGTPQAIIYDELSKLLDGQPSNFATFATYTGAWHQYENRVGLITLFINQVSGKDMVSSKALVETLDLGLPYGDNAIYYGILAEDCDSKDFERSTTLTTSYLMKNGEEYVKYEKNAYNPFSTDPNKAFDGWVINTDEGNKTISYRPTFVEKMKPIKNIAPHTISSSYVTFVWADNIDAYGYRVTVKVNGEIVSINDIQRAQYSVRIQDKDMIEYKVNGLTKGDLVEISVSVLEKDAVGNYRPSSKVYTAKSLVPESTEDLASEKLILDSDPISIEYLHTMESDIGNVTAAGDYYYLTEDDQGNKTYIFFTNTTYSFGNKKITDVVAQVTTAIKKTIDGVDKLEVGNKPGTINFKLDGVDKVAHVHALPSTIAAGNDLAKVEATRVTSDTVGTSYENNDFLGREDLLATDVKELIVGTANEMIFDLEDLSTLGEQIVGFERDYTFFDKEGNPIDNTDDKFCKISVDEKTGEETFKFKQTGECIMKVTPKADIEADEDHGIKGYTNTFVPKAYKENATKMNSLTKIIHLNINEGYNIFSDAELREAFADKDVEMINIQRNIMVEPKSAAMIPYKYVDEYTGLDNELLRKQLLIDGETKLQTVFGGYISIVDRTATMATKGLGLKAYRVAGAGETPMFHDKNGTGYVYDPANATHLIADAKWEQKFNPENGDYVGDFVAFYQTQKPDYQVSMNIHNIDSYIPYCRYGNITTDLVINGNYFSIDASNLPFIHAGSHVTAGSVLANYEIQSHQCSIFSNLSNCNIAFKNLDILGNTSNVSGALVGSTDASAIIAQTMRVTSGGTNGIRCDFYDGTVRGASITVDGVNISNTLIALYCDSDLDAQYVHVKNTWANSIYGYSFKESTVHISHSVIEASGGALCDYEDCVYMNNIATPNNPSAYIDFATCRLENFVTGEEQWFKGYSMEVVALGLKSTIDQGVLSHGYTILKTEPDPITHLVSEYMNWIFFNRCQGAELPSGVSPDSANRNDLGDYIHFNNPGENYVLQGVAMEEGAPIGFVYKNSVTGQEILLKEVTSTPSATLDLTPDGARQFIFAFGKATSMGSLPDIGPAYSFDITGNSYVYFRINQPGFGWIEGIVEAFPLG